MSSVTLSCSLSETGSKGLNTPMEGEYEKEFKQFNLSKKKLKTELISTNWDNILKRMQEYKRLRFPDDNRIITLCSYTPLGTLRVEWK